MLFCMLMHLVFIILLSSCLFRSWGFWGKEQLDKLPNLVTASVLDSVQGRLTPSLLSWWLFHTVSLKYISPPLIQYVSTQMGPSLVNLQWLNDMQILFEFKDATSLDWWSVSHLIIYMFQCYSLRSSHPRLLP